MALFRNTSPTVVAGISLLVWFVPFVPLVFIFLHDLREAHIHEILMLPFLSGTSPAYLFLRLSGVLKGSPWLIWLFGFALPICFAILMFFVSRWRPLCLVAGLLLASAMSWFTYHILKW